MAGSDLASVRLLVDAPLAALLILEVLHRVGEVHVAATDARRFERDIELASRGPDERPPALVLPVTRLLADEHQRRRHWPLAEDGLRRVDPQRARTTLRRSL